MRVLVAIDTSDPAWKALEYTLESHPDADIHAIHVINPLEGSIGDDVYAYEYLIEAQEEDAEQLFEAVEEAAGEAGASITRETVVGQPAREIVEYAEEHDVDQIVIGSHGRSGVSRVLLGSVAETVVRRAPVPVTVIR